MKIQEELIKEYNGDAFVVAKIDGVSKMTFTNGDWIENKEYYGRILLGDCEGCGGISKLYEDFVFDKILIIGLGMGLLPNYAKHVKNCSVIDVIEHNPELIEYVDYLDSSINIIEADAYSYVPTTKYDLILLDIWWKESDLTEDVLNDLSNAYISYLNEGGKIIFPLISKQVEK
jgi:hypothetical protein